MGVRPRARAKGCVTTAGNRVTLRVSVPSHLKAKGRENLEGFPWLRKVGFKEEKVRGLACHTTACITTTLGPKGSGFQGYCFCCGGFGHTAKECPAKGAGKNNQAAQVDKVNGVGGEVEKDLSPKVESVEIGRVWDVSAINKVRSPVGHKSYFSVLSEDEGGSDLSEVTDEEEFPMVQRIRKVPAKKGLGTCGNPCKVATAYPPRTNDRYNI